MEPSRSGLGCRGLSGRRRPPWASGKLAGDYDLLYAYWEEARRRGREDLVEAAMLSERDFDKLRELVGEGPRSALELVERLAGELEARIDEDVAGAAAAGLGLPLAGEEARRRVARLMASWLVEAGEEWGVLRLRPSWGGSGTGGEG